MEDIVKSPQNFQITSNLLISKIKILERKPAQFLEALFSGKTSFPNPLNQ